MIEVVIERNKKGDIIRFTGLGHASGKRQKIATFFKSKKGGDIVCAAVSALLLTSVMSLKQFIGDGIKVKQEKGFLEGYLGEINEHLRTKANIILETMRMGLKCIERDYKEHLKVIEIGGEGNGS
jgi:hypothetical protein